MYRDEQDALLANIFRRFLKGDTYVQVTSSPIEKDTVVLLHGKIELSNEEHQEIKAVRRHEAAK